MIRLLLVWMLLGLPGAVGAACSEIEFENTPYTLCELDAGRDDLALFLRDEADEVYGYFSRVNEALVGQGKRLGIAMNAGMYHDDRRPVGLYIEAGREIAPLVTRAGPGNFGLLPNGVLCLRAGRADVFETLSYLAAAPACISATQSGPMLVIDGALHPRFLPDSTSRFIRNGVGTGPDGQRVVLAISDVPVTFHEFARLFRDRLALNNALYLDGNISRLRAPALGRSGTGFTALGPILGVREPAE